MLYAIPLKIYINPETVTQVHVVFILEEEELMVPCWFLMHGSWGVMLKLETE